MTPVELRDWVLLEEAGVLEADEREKLMGWKAREPEAYARAQADVRALQAEILAGIAPVEPSPAARERLLRRIASIPRTPRRGRRSWHVHAAAAGLLGAAVAAGLVLQIGVVPLGAERDDLIAQLAELNAEVASLDEEIQGLEAHSSKAREQIAVLHSPDSQVMTLLGTALQPGAIARIFWEWEDYLCYLRAENLPPAGSGRGYALWLRTEAGDTVLAGRFSANPRGAATLWTQLPRETGRVVDAFVTLEPSDGPDSPTGDVLLGAAL